MRIRLFRVLGTPFGLLVALLFAMWVIEAADTFVLSSRLQTGGIHPRRLDGLDGIPAAPFLHAGWGHIASNSVPLLFLGGLVAVRGWHHWLTISAVVMFGGGAATWALASGANHIGASGMVFGYFGALLGAAFFERRAATVGPALLVIMMYSTMLVGLVPQEGISWEGHLFGLLAGLLAARMVAEPRDQSPEAVYQPEPWELDEPWLRLPTED